MRNWKIQVQAQFDVDADSVEDACDEAVSRAMDMEPTEWGTIVFGEEKRPTWVEDDLRGWICQLEARLGIVSD